MKKIVSAKACWIVSGIAVSMLFLVRLPSADAAGSVPVAQSTATPTPAGSVPVVQSTATPAPCVGHCHIVLPDVVAMTNVFTPQVQIITYLPKADLVISRVIRFPQELDIEFTTSGGLHETIHLPSSVPPRSSLLRFPQDATLDSVLISGISFNGTDFTNGFTARILYHQGSDGLFNAYTVSGRPVMTAP